MLEHLKNKTILFLEDNPDFVENTVVLFQVFVKTVYHAPTIAEALEIIRSHPIDIIISDIKLKNENGLDFIRDFRMGNSSTPIIILSGHKDEEFLFRSIPLNLTAYLLKPIKYNELIEALYLCSEKIVLSQNKIIELKEGWYYDTESKVLEKEGKNFPLNKKETLFIELVTQHLNRLITKDMMHASVWNFEDMSDSAVTNFILRIRRRFGKSFIYTILDLGYRLKL
jgi:two-component system, OmpR family, response regulator VanR